MLRYQNNAFRILGLKPNVSMQEIIQRVNEFKVKKSLGMDVVYEYDFPWMGPLDRSEQNVLNALQRLENPVSQLREEIFWFWFETDCDKKAINYLKKNDRQAAHKTWNALITEENPTKESMSAFMNQIILAHSSVIGEECIVRYEDETKKQKKKNITFDQKHWKNWKVVISRFTLIASNKVFWEMVKNKAEKIDDPRLSSSKVDEIRNNFLQDIAEPNFTFMSDALISKDYERVKQHSSLLKEDWIPNESSLPSEVLRKGFNRILASQTDLLNRHAQNAAKELKKVEKGEKDADKVVIDIYSQLNNKVTDIIYEGNLVDINNISDFALAKDKVAEGMRDCAIELNNNLNSNISLSKKEIKSERFQAYEMIRKAIEYASTTYTKQKYEKDEEVIKNNLEMAGGSSEFADTADTKQKYEKDEEVIKKNLEKAGKSSGINWVAILSYLCVGAIILFFIIIPNLPDNSSSSNRTTTSTPSDKQNTQEVLSWEELSKKYYAGELSVKPPSIYSSNKTTTSTSLPTKTWDWVPPISTSSEETYVVEVGDSLGKIAQKFGTTTEKIIARNELANPNLIRPGQKLIIPTE
jgi:LysM repeat protein